MRGFPLQSREEADAARDALEDEDRERKAIESAWNKIDNKIHAAKGSGQEYAVKFTLLELKMLRQFRRKFS